MPIASDRDTLAPLILDLVEWIAVGPRLYTDVMDAWRTSCPRLPVWEEAIDRGYIARCHVAGQEVRIEITPAGRRFLEEQGRAGCLTSLPSTRTRRVVPEETA